VAPTQGSALVTRFRLQVSNCRASVVYQYALVTSTGDRPFLSRGTGLCSLDTQLSSTTVALEVCAIRSARICALASVSVQEAGVSSAALTSLIAQEYATSQSLPAEVGLQQLSTKMKFVADSLDALPEGEASEVVLLALGYLEEGLARINVLQTSGFVVNGQPVDDITAAARTCPQLQTLPPSSKYETFTFETTNHSAEGVALLNVQMADILRIESQAIVFCTLDSRAATWARNANEQLSSIAVYYLQLANRSHTNSLLQFLLSTTSLPIARGITPQPAPVVTEGQLAAMGTAEALLKHGGPNVMDKVLTGFAPAMLNSSVPLPMEVLTAAGQLVGTVLGQSLGSVGLNEEEMAGKVLDVFQLIAQASTGDGSLSIAGVVPIEMVFKVIGAQFVGGAAMSVGTTEVSLGAGLTEVVAGLGLKQVLITGVQFSPVLTATSDPPRLQPYGNLPPNVTAFSPVVSLTMAGRGSGKMWTSIAVSDTKDAVTLAFRLTVPPALALEAGTYAPLCEYLDRSVNGSSNWSQAGCRLANTSSANSEQTCVCDHLTEFRSILAVIPTPNIISVSDIMDMLQFSSPLLHILIILPFWIATLSISGLLCCRDRRRRRKFIDVYYPGFASDSWMTLWAPLSPKRLEDLRMPSKSLGQGHPPWGKPTAGTQQLVELGRAWEPPPATERNRCWDVWEWLVTHVVLLRWFIRYPVSHNIHALSRVCIVAVPLSTYLVLAAIWFRSVDIKEPIWRWMPQTLFIMATNMLILRVLGQLCKLAFGRCCGGWRPKGLPYHCPEPEPMLFEALQAIQLAQRADVTTAVPWDAPLVRLLADETQHVLLQSHLQLIAAAFESEEHLDKAMQKDVPVEDVPALCFGPQLCQEPVSQTYQLAIVALRLGHFHASWTLFRTALQHANPDFVTLTDLPAYRYGTLALAKALEKSLGPLRTPLWMNPAERMSGIDPAGLRPGFVLQLGEWHQPHFSRHAAADGAEDQVQNSPRSTSTSPCQPSHSAWGADTNELDPVLQLARPLAGSPVELSPVAPTVVAGSSNPWLLLPMLDFRCLLHERSGPHSSVRGQVHRVYTWEDGLVAARRGDYLEAFFHFAHAPIPESNFAPFATPRSPGITLLLITLVTQEAQGTNVAPIIRDLMQAGVQPRFTMLTDVQQTMQQPVGILGSSAHVAALQAMGSTAGDKRKDGLKAARAAEDKGRMEEWRGNGLGMHLLADKTGPQATNSHAWHGPTATALLNAVLGPPGVVYVDPSAHPHFQTGSVLHPYTTLEAAVRTCHKGATIILMPGRYPPLHLQHLHCPLDHPLHIQGVSKESVFIGGWRRLGRKSRNNTAWALRLEDCCNLAFSNLTLHNANVGLKVGTDCVLIQAMDIHIRDTSYSVLHPDAALHNIHFIMVLDCSYRPWWVRCWGSISGVGIRPKWPHWWQAVFQVVCLIYMILMTLLLMTYSEAFYNETGDSTKTHAFIGATWLSLIMDAGLKLALPGSWAAHQYFCQSYISCYY